MTSSFPGASLVAIGLLSLLSACASTSSSSDTQAANQKVASNCEVVSPSVGSNMSKRHCDPAPVPQTNSQSTSQ